MPELPEVEHAARTLRRWLRGRKVVRAEADATRVFRGGGRAAFARALAGRRLRFVERRGKVLLVGFDRDVGFLSRLGMTGKWLRRKQGAAPPKHSRARLVTDRGETIHYVDPRLFGRITPHPASALLELPEVRALGPDPLLDGLDPAALHERLGRTRRAVKVALMDQALVAGVGNILATEALFRARLHPARPARSLSLREVKALVRGIEASIAHTLEAEQGEEITYVEEDPDANPFLVYDRAGSPCPRCRTTLARLALGGRTSAYCPRCQRP